MLKAVLTFIIIVSACCAAQSQTVAPAGGTAIARGVIVDGDTIPHVRLREIKIMPRRRFRSKRAAQRYSRLVRNIKTVLPYARIAGRKIAEIEDNLALMSDEKQKKEYLKKAEKELFQEFEKPLRRLTVSQGRLLIKLIDRETGSTSYAIIRQLKGRFSAFLWQSVARIFGSNLKSEFDGEGEDRMIEYIINQIDNGEL